MPDVFISYKREEREAAALIAQKLSDLRVDVWFDNKLVPGGTFDEEIASQLRSAAAVLICWTPAAIESEWVRAEASFALQQGKLIACFLEPAELIPPFNLIHAEDLTTWAGQDDDPAWLKLLERIGHLAGRPGLSTYPSLLLPATTLATLRAWTAANGDDPLAAAVWDRIAQLEGEGSAERIAREKAEARELDKRRKAQRARSRELAKARGIRSGRLLPRRFVALAIAVLAVVLLGVAFVVDNQRRESALSDADTPAAVRALLVNNRWHPIAASARRKLERMDGESWERARSTPSIAALDGYLSSFPGGAHEAEARKLRAEAERVRDAQVMLARIGRYSGARDGAVDTPTGNAIKTFQFERGMVVTGSVDDRLLERLKVEVKRLAQVQPDELVSPDSGPPTADQYRDIAARLKVDAPTLEAIRQVEALGQAFDEKRRPVILFERQIFSRATQRRFDESHPELSAPRFSIQGFRRGDAAWAQLKAAWALDPEAAYQATTFGMFQITGVNHKVLGFETAAEYARFVSQSQANQVEAFARFVERQGVLKYLQTRDWAGFARRWNGPAFSARYAERLDKAYNEAAQRFGR